MSFSPPLNPIVSGAWAVRVPLADAWSLAGVRLIEGIRVCEAVDCIWARGEAMDDALDLAARKLAGERFWIVDQDRLLRDGQRIPRGRLPDGNWVALSQWMAPVARAMALPGRVPGKIALRWEASTQFREPGVMIASAVALRRWATKATNLRLKPLRFAVSSGGKAIVHGSLLPPIAGNRYVENSGVAWPSGLSPRPAVDAALLAEILNLGAGDLAVFDQDGSYVMVEAKQFVPLSRGSVRSSILEGTE
ncbi:MAG: hypothetical protein M3O30_07640 [Planctomycetota bacterium]|nr:hypothetical protein [Planctomycetota bacterium]